MNTLFADALRVSGCLLWLRSRSGIVTPLCAGFLVLFIPTSVTAQCGATVDCPLAPLPLGPLSTTEITPGGNFFNFGPLTFGGAPVPPPNPDICFPTTSEVRGMDVMSVGAILEAIIFTSPGPGDPPGSPTIEVVGAGATLSVFPLTGTTLMCAGVACLPGLGESIGITDAVIATVSGGVTTELPLPLLPDGVTTSAPVSAAGIFGCLGASNSFTLAVETSVPTIEVIGVGGPLSFAIPSPIVFTPDSFSSGPSSGVVVYTAMTVYTITGGLMTPIALPVGTTFVSKTTTAGGITVVDSAGGTTFIPALGTIVAFGSCVAPLDSCTAGVLTPSGSAIAMNIPPMCAGAVDGATATWPAPFVSCAAISALEPIPTVSQWGMIIMTLLLLTAGTIVLGRQRRPAVA